ncbi:hypothetical protein POTOM_050445 [Populus tomentosa]|uniref:CCHC-type domain-containing protein n=1 Tax=Populus tomentosa TaxID=118781 RepID=A0A8X7Y953_POPTO|nr:hypothetical protein POTOM_050445 [Populus tomentosa]
MHTIYSLTEAINLATKVEAQLDRTRSTGIPRSPIEPIQTTLHKGRFPLNPPPPMSNFARGPSSSKTQVTTTGVVPPEAPRNPYSRPASDKFYRCGQPGHHSNQCPKRGVVNLIEPGEDTGLPTGGVEDEPEYTYEDEEITRGMMESYSHVLWSLGDCY